MFFIWISEIFGALFNFALEASAPPASPSPSPARGHDAFPGKAREVPTPRAPDMPSFDELSNTCLRKSSFPRITGSESKLFSTDSVLTRLPVYGAHLAASGWWATSQVESWSQLTPQANGKGTFLLSLHIPQLKSKISEKS